MKVQSSSFVSILVFVVGAFPASEVSARGERCAHMFTNADFKKSINASETHRRLMLNYVQQMQIEIRSQIKDRHAAFDAAVRRRNLVRDSDIHRSVQSSPMLSQFDFSALETGPMIGRVKPPAIDMEKPLDVGYFEWLKHNSLEFRMVDDGQLFQDGSYRPTVKQVEPLDLLRRYVEEGLPLDLSLKLVQEKLDPTLPTEAREAAISLRRLTALDTALEQQILPYLGIRLSVDAANQAWSLFTSPTEARTNLMRLLREQVAQHGEKLPKRDYERLMLAMSEQPGYFAPMTRYLEIALKGALSEAHVGELATYLGEMKANLRLSPDLENGHLSTALVVMGKSGPQSTYEMVLIDAFSKADSQLPDKIKALRKIIAISDAMKSREALVSLVESHIPPSRTP